MAGVGEAGIARGVREQRDCAAVFASSAGGGSSSRWKERGDRDADRFRKDTLLQLAGDQCDFAE